MLATNLLIADGAQIVAWAAASGASSMLLYRFTSPQKRLKELESEAAATRRALNDLDQDFQAAWPLIRRSLRLAFARVRLALGPSLLAGLPVLLAIYLMESKLSAASVLPVGPAWLQSGWVAFFAICTVAALSIKLALKIK